MPLISGDNTKNRLKRSAPDAASTTPARTNKRPNLLKAAGNATKSVLRSKGMLRIASKDVIEYRERKCAACDIQTFIGGGEYCGHRYLDVTLGRVRIEDVQGCGCELGRKRSDPNESCPRESPEWVAELQIDPGSFSG